MDEVVKELAEHGKIEQSPVQHGRRMTCMIVPHR
jgi:translation initiation factor IF-3